MKAKSKTSFSVLKQMIAGKDETKALAKAIESLGVPAEQLHAAHTEKKFVFNIIATGTSENANVENGKTFTVEKNPELTLQQAKKLAMNYFETFEGNIKIVDQDETHIVFSKVR